MERKINITLVPKSEENLSSIKSFLERLGHHIDIIDPEKVIDELKSEVIIYLIDTFNQEVADEIENKSYVQPIIINYKHISNANLQEKYQNKYTFYRHKDYEFLPIVLENTILKIKYLTINDKKKTISNNYLDLIESLIEENSNKNSLDSFINDALFNMSRFAGAEKFHFFLFPKFRNLNVLLYNKLAVKYEISLINKIYPDLKSDVLMNTLNNNQEIIIFKKDGNVKTDITDIKEIPYYCLIAIPVIINNSVYGCIVFNFQKAKTDIDALRKELALVSKLFCFQLQYRIIYNQYETSINQFSRLIKDAINGIYQSSEEGKIIYANPAFLKMVGYDSLEELKKIDLGNDLYLSNDDRKKFINKINEEKSVVNYESVLKRKNGDLINIIENSRVIENIDGTRTYEGIVSDITNQINLKQKLEYQTSFSEKIIENAPFLIVAFNEKNQVIMWNSKAEKVTGYDRNEIYNDPNLVNLIFSEIDSIEQHLSLLFKNENSVIDDSRNVSNTIAKDGANKTIRWSWIANKSSNESRKIVFGFGLDITETKSLEEQLFESQKMESIGTLAAGMAYDFSKILNELNVYNSSLKSILDSESKEFSYVNKIEEAIQKASTFTSKIIGLSRTDKKKDELINVNSAIDYVIDLLQNTTSETIFIEKDLCNEPIIRGDISKIHQVILNVGINAKEALDEQGKIQFKSEIVLTRSDQFLNHIKPSVSNYIKITIQDDGKGIPLELHKRIFDPFYTTKQYGKSAGLGLSVAYNIIKNHDGYIDVLSEPEKGTKIIIYLPYAIKPTDGDTEKIDRDVKEDKSAALADGKIYKILVVDDEIIIRDLLNDVLVDQNYEIILAKDGIEGLELYKKYIKSIDMVILDIIMPGMSGKEVFEKIRELNPKAKIIITSGYSKQIVTEELMSKGANGFLPKPFNIDKLLGLIKALIQENS